MSFERNMRYLANEDIVDQMEQPPVPEINTFEVSLRRENEAIKEIEKFNRFLERSNLPKIQYSFSGIQEKVIKGGELQEQREHDPNREQEEGVYIQYFKTLTIEVNPLRDLDWEIAGTKEPISAIGVGTAVEGNVIFLKHKYYKGPAVPEEIQKSGLKCEYCNSNHARSKSIILHNKKTNEFKEVGRSCVKFLMGNLNLEKYMHSLETLVEELEGFGGSFEKVRAVPVIPIIAGTIYVVNEDGRYISKGMAEGKEGVTSTANTVSRYLYTQIDKFMPPAAQAELLKAKDGIKALYPKAEEIYQWWKDNEASMEKNDFLDKLRSILKFDHINPKLQSFVVYLYPLYQKTMGVEPVQKGEPAPVKKESEFVGNPGDKMERQLFLRKVAGFNSQFGYTYIYLFEDKDGNAFKWKTGTGGLKELHTYTLKFTIKGHEEYRGVKQTEITRAKVVSEKNPEVFTPQFD